MSARDPAEVQRPYTLPPRHAAHPGRVVAAAVVVLLILLMLASVLTNKNMEWGIVARYFLGPPILLGLLRTLELTVICMAVGIALGVLLAVARLSENRVLSSIGLGYVWLFRGTPLLVQLIFWFNLSALYPHLAGVSTNTLITPMTAAILGLGLHEAAYMCEIARAGILSIDHGQHEAAGSLGMTRPQTLVRIIIPQAMRTIVPPTGNRVIAMLKDTSLVSVLAMPELLYSAQLIYTRTYQTIPLLTVAVLWYLIVVSVLSIGQHYVEKRYSRGIRKGM